MLDLVLEHARAGDGMAGSLFWSAVGSLHSESDDFSVHLTPLAAPVPTAKSSTSTQPLRTGVGDVSLREANTLPSSESPPHGTAAEASSSSRQEAHQAGQVRLEERGRVQGSGATVWVDEEVVEVLKVHAKAIGALNSSWGECPLM